MPNHTTTATTKRRRLSSSSSSSLMKRSLLGTMIMLGASSSPLFSNSLSVITSVDAISPVSEALSALKSIDYRYFVAGGTCAAFSHGITTPIDVVKTKLQANPKKYEGKGLVGATVQICRDKEEGGPKALLKGLGPTVLGYGIEGAMKFGCYEISKPIFLALLGHSHQVLAFCCASFIAGSIAAVLLVPMESLRIKQVTQQSYQLETIVSGLPRIIREDGFFIMMSGVWAMLAKQVPYTFGKQVSFDLIAKYLYSITDTILSALSTTELKWVVSLTSAFLASIVACLCSQPGDMILTETYSSNGGDKPGNFLTVVKGIYSTTDGDGNSEGNGGISEFFRGTKARIVHVGVIITSQLVVYDFVKQLLGLPATGSH
mmetsp:Transcript_44540/g.48194  ORF Transcript_44540/g.48194 Transcript_44540/m.48194 type:complete len:374 (-) Transcript_44540:282-1403(-)